MTKTPRRQPAAISRKEASQRTVAIAALNGIALIHLLEIPHKLEHAPYMAGLFAALILACAALSALLTTADARSAPALWSAAGTLAAATMAGYAASRSIGLPGLADHVGDWANPAGTASLALELAVVGLAAHAARDALGAQRPTPPPHQRRPPSRPAAARLHPRSPGESST